MGKVSSIKNEFKALIQKLKEYNPITYTFDDGILAIHRKEIKEIQTDQLKPNRDGKCYLAIVDGQYTDVKECEEKGDDMVLEYEDKLCAITSKPLLVGQHKLYFTKQGFLGSMALNQDTLLGGDVYQPSVENTHRKISKEINFDRLGIDIEAQAIKENDDHYIVSNESIGDVASLHGSKKTLKEVNKAQRLRKLLKPSSFDRKQAIALIGAGCAIGMYVYPNFIAG